jgi:predicted phosphodiesterase
MPLTLPPISRRRFLTTSVAGVAAIVLGPRWSTAAAAGQRDPDRIALLSDIHCPANPKSSERGVNMTQHFQQAIAQVLELEKSDRRPAAAIVSGDCAYHTGDVEDYQALLGVIAPLAEAGLPIHMAMGNHDERQHFAQTVPYQKLGANAAQRAMDSRHLLLLRSPRVDWVLLDSCDKVNASPGLLGPEQLDRLKGLLDAPERSNKPVIVVVHHEPISAPRPATGPASTQPVKKPSLVDARGLLDLLLPRKQVKAVVYGHTHVWSVQQLDGLHMVNLPAVAYVFDAAQPSAWVDCRLADEGMRLELHCLKANHPKQGEAADLRWRS